MTPAIFFLAALIFPYATQFPAPTTITLHGKVLQDTTNQPIRKATVALTCLTPTPFQGTATTNVEGEFTIDNIPLGRYSVLLVHPGFIAAATGRAAYITIQPDTAKAPIILRMQPAAVITGKILDPDGDPLRHASVAATRISSRPNSPLPDGYGVGDSNDLGEFRISGLRPGQYNVTASAMEPLQPPSSNPQAAAHTVYALTYYPGTLVADQSTPVDLHSGEEARITFGVLTARAFHMSGTVTGIPPGLAIAQLMLHSTTGSPDGTSELHDGKFEFPNLLPGSYTPTLITASFDNGQPRMQMLRLGQPIEITNADINDLHLQPEIGGNVRGKFRLDTEQKFDWTQLTVALQPMGDTDFPGAGFSMPLTDRSIPQGISSVHADGTFDLNSVPGENYELIVQANSQNLHDYFTKSITLDGRDVSDFGIPVHADTFIDVVISAAGASVSGTVLDAQGQPVPDATVVDLPSTEHHARSDLYQRALTDSAGHFALQGLSPGKYTILAFEELTEDPRHPDFAKSHQSQSASVELTASSSKTVTLKLIPATN